MQELSFFAATLCASFAFSVLFRTPRKYLPATITLTILVLYSQRFLNQRLTSVYATFVVAMGSALCSQIIARRTRTPAQAFLIPGIITLVPGSHLYRSFSAMLSSDFTEAFREAVVALMITCSISFALLLANWLIPSRRDL